MTLVGCGGPSVASIQVSEPLVAHTAGRVPLDARALDQDGDVLADVAVAVVAVAETAIARLGHDGSVRCEANGTTAITLGAGDHQTQVDLRCLLISAIEPAHASLTLEAASDQGRTLAWRVLDLAGEPVEGVPVALSVADPSVARVEGTRVFGVTPGRTTLTWTAGDVTAQVSVRVGKPRLVREGMTVPKGGIDLPLEPGEWGITVSALAPVTVESRGGRCSDTDAGLVHHLICDPTEPTQLHIEPTGLLRDPTTAHVRGVYFPPS